MTLADSPVFLNHRKYRVALKHKSSDSYDSKKRSAQDAHLAERKKVASDTARARKCAVNAHFIISSNVATPSYLES